MLVICGGWDHTSKFLEQTCHHARKLILGGGSPTIKNQHSGMVTLLHLNQRGTPPLQTFVIMQSNLLN